jgi:hypothetical protein
MGVERLVFPVDGRQSATALMMRAAFDAVAGADSPA